MKLIWCPETAAKAYMDTVKTLAEQNLESTDTAELLSAMAGGWKAALIVEVWAPGDGPDTSLGLISAARHTRGRHVCVVPDQKSAAQYAETMRLAGEEEAAAGAVVVGAAAEEMQGVEMMVVDFRRRDAGEVLSTARPGPRGMVVVCNNGGGLRRGEAAIARVVGRRVVRSAFLPIGRGIEVLHVGVGRGPRLGGGSRWIKYVDKVTGEEHVFRT